ncbi:NB-ARC domain-containing protein [Saccharicrinis aurantiacus]|uniref:NB-ARC domain-containing protein n=1 Tax=Saccharicrinis aurantiacus TaxID=1849719 RepID=UPI00094F82F6|nr:NB-ARC domain-containing protein [Saccharicrinis aurantiacus]
MNNILSKLNQKINFLEGTNQTESLKIHYQSKLEYSLIITLAYFWNKNWEKLNPDDKEYCISSILRPSIGSIAATARKLDLDKEVFGNKKEKDLYRSIDKYPKIRNEKIGHGYTFEDNTNDINSTLIELIESIERSTFFIFNEPHDLILVQGKSENGYFGINFKPDGFNYAPWKCPINSNLFDLNSIYILNKNNEYHKLSPFIELSEEGDPYLFSSVEEKLTGRTKYNQLLKTGIILKDKEEFGKLLISTDKHKRKTASGTIINNFDKNYKKFIDIGIKAQIKQFLLKNKSSVFATIWGHGGVGKTATIQSLCEDLSNDTSKYFDYIIFISAKDRYYNYYKGAIHDIENSLDSLEGLISYTNQIICNNEKYDSSTILDFEGQLLLIIDDFETFSKKENKAIIEFIKKLNINHHKVVLTTRSATFVTGEEIKTNELNIDETKKFLIEAAQIELPGYNISHLEKEVLDQDNLGKIHKITSGRPLFIFQFVVLLGQKGSIKETLSYDIRSTKAAINFLYDRIYDYLSADAKNMFVAVSLLTTEDDLTNLIEKLRFILNKEDKEEEFQGALNELIKLKIIELIDKDFFKVYSTDIYRLMKKYYENKGPEYEGNITSRFQLISNSKSLNTEWALLENADSSRIVSSEEVIENKYRYILNREQCPEAIKIKAVVNFSSYLVIHKNKIEKAIKLYDDYYHQFDTNNEYVKHYSRYCWTEGSDEMKAKAVEILQHYFLTKPKIDNDIYIELLGLLMVYSTVLIVREREELKETLRYGDLSRKQYNKIYNTQKDRFKELFKYPGLKLYRLAKEENLVAMNSGHRHSCLEGLFHFVEICMRNVRIDLAKEVCQYVIDVLPQNFQKPFIFKLSKIDAIENPKRKIDPYKKVETEFGLKLKDALLKK